MWPAIIGGVGSLIAGVGSLAAMNASRKAYNTALDANKLSNRVAEARAAGISPLVALGASPVNVPWQSGAADHMEAVGQNIGSALTKFADARHRRALENLDIQRKTAEVKNVELQNLALSKQISSSSVPVPDNELSQTLGIVGQQAPRDVTIAPLDRSVTNDMGVTFKRPDVPLSQSMGTSAGYHPFYDAYIDDLGDVWYLPNERLADVLDADLVDRWRYYGKRVGEVGGSWYDAIARRFSPSERKRVLAFLRKKRPGNAPNGYEFRWNELNAAWRLVYRGKGPSRMFDEPESDKIGKRPYWYYPKGSNRKERW